MSDMVAIDWRKDATPYRFGAAADACRRKITDACRTAVADACAGLANAGRTGMDLVLARPGAAVAVLSACLGWIILMATSEPLSATRGTAPRPAKAVLATVASPAAWIDIVKPISIFDLEAPEFESQPALIRARRHLTGGGREDVLSLGTMGALEPALQLSVYRRGQESYARDPTFADVARQAAEAGFSITRSGLPDLLTTRFGRFEIVDVALAPVVTPAGDRKSGGPAPASSKQPPMPCTGLRLVLDRPALTMTGLACGPHRQGFSHDRLACLLDRLDLASGGDDRALIEFFAASELKRNGTCSGARLGPDLAHAAWLDDRPVAAPPPLAPQHRPATHRKNVRHH